LIGIDSSAQSIEAAKQRIGADDPRIQFRVHAVGETLPFESTSLDAVYSNNLIECIVNRDAFADEIGRVLKPGGWMVMAHWDWDSQVFDSQDKDLVRRLVIAFADYQQGWMDRSDGWMGRRLWGVFNATKLFRGEIVARALINTVYAAPWYGHARAQDFSALVRRGLVSTDDYGRFVAEQEELSALGKYFYSITGFAYVGQRIV
jgi:ubiquinone/menaquinone biosynthesis C-methylase UbiE